MVDSLPEFDIKDEDFDTAWTIKVTSKPLKKGDPIVAGSITYNTDDLPTSVTYRLWDDSTEVVTYTYNGTISVTFKGVEYVNYAPNLFQGTIDYKLPSEVFPPITDITISNNSVNEADPVGTAIGIFASEGGTSPYTYAEIADPSDVFEVVGDELRLSDTVEAVNSPYSVTIQSTDDNGKTFSKVFSITVTEAFVNTHSVEFVGTNEYCEIPIASAIQEVENFSISFWAKRTSSGGTRIVVSEEANSGGTSSWSIWMRQAANTMRVVSYVGGVNNNNNSSTNIDTAWNHFCATFGDSGDANIRFYINGAIDTTWGETFPLDTPSQGLYFGAGPNPGSVSNLRNFFTGLLNNVSYWDKNLSLSEVQEIYNSGVPDVLTETSMSANLVGWWKCGTGDVFPTLLDTIGSNNATMVNMSGASFVTDVPT